MKNFFLSLFIFHAVLGISQERNINQEIKELNNKINQSIGAQRLMLMDSLSNTIFFETDLEIDSIIQATISYAKELDSFNIAVRQSINLITNYNYNNGDVNKAKNIIEETLPLVLFVSKSEILSKFYYECGLVYFNLNDFEASLKAFENSHKNALKDSSKFVGLSKTGIGMVYTDKGEFGKASLELQDAIGFFQKTKDTTLMNEARNSLAILYSKNGFYKEAKQERDEIIRISEIKKLYNSLPALYYNTAADANKMNNQLSRIAYLKKAIEATQKSDYVSFYTPIMVYGLATAYAENDSIALAENSLKILDTDFEKNTTGYNRAFYLDAIKRIAFAKKEYSKAIQYGKEYLNLKLQGKQYEEIQGGEKFLYKVYEIIGNKEKAFNHYINYTKIKDSIESVQKSRVLAYYQTLYETEKRDLTIKNQENNISILDTKNKLKNQWLLFGGLGLVTLFGFILIIRSRNYAKKKQKLQEAFTQDLLKTQENERARIASELHDSVGQKLLIIKNSLVGNKKEVKNEIDLVGETIKEVREMSHNLHPFQFEKIGLIASLKNMVATFQKNSNIFYSEDIEAEDGLISKEKEIYVFRMLQECITNVEKHAEATACNLSSREEKNQLVFILKDNGKGFNFEKNSNNFEGLGMKTLKERAQFINAILNIESNLNKGTTITIKISKKIES